MKCTGTDMREQLILSKKLGKSKAGPEGEQVFTCWTREGRAFQER